MGSYGFFFDWRDKLCSDYSGILQQREIEGEEDISDPISFEESNRSKFFQVWSWYHLISKHCDDDLLRIKALYDVEIKALLNHLSYIQSRNNLKIK